MKQRIFNTCIRSSPTIGDNNGRGDLLIIIISNTFLIMYVNNNNVI